MIKIRKELINFAEEMELKMRKNDDEKGDSYKTLPHPFLVNKFYEEKKELEDSSFLDENECIDVALMSFMLWYWKISHPTDIN